MADITFDVWLKRNRKPGESMREAISRYSDEQFVGRRGRDYLTEVFSDEIEAEDQVKLAEQPEPPPDPDEQPYADFGETMYKSLVGLGETGAGLAATVLPEGYGKETMTEIAQDLQEVKTTEKPAATYEDYVREGGFIGGLYEMLPESAPTFGEMGEGALESFFPTVTSIAGATLGFFTQGPTGMVLGGTLGASAGSTAVVTGGTYTRVLEDDNIREALGVQKGVDYTELSDEEQARMRDIASEIAGDTGLTRSYTSGVLELPSNLFLPWIKGWGAVKQVAARYGMDVLGGTAAEVMDEQVYAYEVKQNLMEAGLDEAQAEAYRQKIREMGPTNFETAWGAFVNEVVMGGAPAVAEATTAYALKRDHRVDAPATINEELTESITDESLEAAYAEAEKEIRDQEQQARKEQEAELKRRRDEFKFQQEAQLKTLQIEDQKLRNKRSAEKIKDETGQTVGAVEQTLESPGKTVREKLKRDLVPLEQAEAKKKKPKRGKSGKFETEEQQLTPSQKLNQIGQMAGEERLAQEVREEFQAGQEQIVTDLEMSESERREAESLETASIEDIQADAYLQETQQKQREEDQAFLESERREQEGMNKVYQDMGVLSYSEASNPNKDTFAEALADVDTKLPEEQQSEILDQKIEVLENEMDNPGGRGVSPLSFRMGQAALKSITKFFSGVGVKISAITREQRYAGMVQGLYGPEFAKSTDPLEEKRRHHKRLKSIYKGEGFAVGVSQIVIAPESIYGETERDAIKRMVQVVFHEVFGHYGLRMKKGGTEAQPMSKDYKDMMYGFGKFAKKDIKAWLNGSLGYGYQGQKYNWEKDVDFDKGDISFKQIEEYVARNYAEYGIQKEWAIDRLVQSLRKMFKGFPGFNSVTDRDLIEVLNQLQDEYIPNNRSIVSGNKQSKKPKAQVQTPEEQEEEVSIDPDQEISESRRPSDFDRFVSFGGKPPLRQFDKKKFDTRRAPKKTAQDAERYVDASILESMEKKTWPEQLVKDLSNFESFPQEFQDSFRKSLKSGLRKREQELANAVLAKGRQAFLQKKKGNVTPDTSATKGFEQGGAKWKELVDDVPKFARTTPEIQRAMRAQDISESQSAVYNKPDVLKAKNRILRQYGSFENLPYRRYTKHKGYRVVRFDKIKDYSDFKNYINRLDDTNKIREWKNSPLSDAGEDASFHVAFNDEGVLLRDDRYGDKVGIFPYESDAIAAIDSLDDISESKISDDPKARKMMVLPPKALPGGRVFQQWADRKMIDAEDAPEYRAGGRVIDVSDGMPASAKQPDMTGTTVPYAEIDTNFPGNRASFNVSGVDSQKKIKGVRRDQKVAGNRISGGAIIKANLIGQGQAKFIDALPGVNTTTKNIATLQAEQIRKYNEEKDVQKSKKGNYSDHLFATKIVYDTDVELSTTGTDKPQPSVRPTTYGDIIVGNQVATIRMGDRIAPLYDSLYVVAPGDDISFSYVGEKGFAEFNKRNPGSLSAKEFMTDLSRQKKGQKGGRWFNPGLPDDKWRLEVPNTGTKLKSMPISFNGRDANWVVDFDASKFEGTRKPEGRRVSDNKKVRLAQSLPWLSLKNFVDIGVLADYYPKLNDAYVHFAEDMQGEPLYYGTAIQLPDDNNGLSFILGVKPPDPEVIEFLDQSNMGASTRDWLEDIYMDKMNQAGHDGIPHRLIGSLLHEIQHYIQGVEGFEKGGNPEEMMNRLGEDRIKNSIRNNTKGVWVSISPNSRLRIQKRFAKVMEDRFGIDEAKKKIAAFGFKTPYRGTAWAKGNLFLDDDPFKTYERWGKKTRLNMMDMLTMPYQLSEALENKRNALFKDVTSGLAGAIGSLVREKAISKNDVAKLLKSVNELMVPFNLNVLGMASVEPLSTRIVGDDWSQMIAQSDYLRLAGEIEARDVEQRYIDMIRGNGRSGLPTILNEQQKKILEKKSPTLPFLRGGTERDITTIGKGNYTGSIPMNVPGEKPLGAPWDVKDMISYSMSDPLADYADRLDITTRTRIAQINNLEKGTPQRREAIRQLHLDMMLNPIPFGDPTKPLPYQDELTSSVPFEDLSWSQRLPGHELSAKTLFKKYLKDPAEWEKIRVAKGGYSAIEETDVDPDDDTEATGAGGRKSNKKISGLGLRTKASLKKKKKETQAAYEARLKKQAEKDFGTMAKRAARLLYMGKIWTNWQTIRDMFGLNAGGRGRDAVPYLGHIISFMKMQRDKLMKGELTPRDIVKSVVMTLASQGADANNPWTVYNFTGGVKKAKSAKSGKKPANLKTYVEYMNGADWVKGNSKTIEANIGQKELNGELTEEQVAEWYNKSPLWVVSVPWTGEGPVTMYNEDGTVDRDTTYADISDGALYKKTVSFEEALRTPKYSLKDVFETDKDGNIVEETVPVIDKKTGKQKIKKDGTPQVKKVKIKTRENRMEASDEMQYTGGRPEIVKVKGQWKLRIDGKNYAGMADYLTGNKTKLFEEMPLWYRDPGNNDAPNAQTGAVWVPQEYATTGGKPRMEDAVAYYFSTDAGQALLDGIEKGEFDLKEWRKLANVRMAYGDDRLNQLLKPAQRKKNGEFKKAGLQDIVEYTEGFNKIIKDVIGDLDPKDLQGNDEASVELRFDLAKQLGEYAQKLYGIAGAKQAFFKHFLGLGDAPTIDAIEYNTHIAGSPATDLAVSPLTGKPVANTWRVDLKWWALKLQDLQLSNYVPGVEAKAKGETFFDHYRNVIQTAFDDIKRDVDSRDPSIFEDVPPDYFYHVMHHWLWDVGKALTRADAVMGKSTERFRPAAYEAMWRDAAQKVLSYFRKDPIEAEMVPWVDPEVSQFRDITEKYLSEPEPGQIDGVFELSEGDAKALQDGAISESVNLQPLVNKLMQRSIADRFATGFYVAKDQTSTIWPDTYQGKKGYWMRGGIGYPLLDENINGIQGVKPKKGQVKGRAAWASNNPRITKQARDLQKLGAEHVLTVIGSEEMHFSNKAYWAIWWRETQDLMRNKPAVAQKVNDAIDTILNNDVSKNIIPLKTLLLNEKKNNPGKSNWELLKATAPELSFQNRKPVVDYFGGSFGTKTDTAIGYSNKELWKDTTIFKGAPMHLPVGIIKLDAVGNQFDEMTHADIGVPKHDAYPYVVQGELIASFIDSFDQPVVNKPIADFKEIFEDLQERIHSLKDYPSAMPFRIDERWDTKKGKWVKSKFNFGSVKTPYKLPGAVISNFEQLMDAPTTPISFSEAVTKLSTQPGHVADFNNARQKQAEYATSESIFSRPLDQDLELPGGRKISDIVTRFMEPFGKTDAPEMLRDIRRRTRGRILRIEEAGSKLYKALFKTKNPEIIYKYLTTKGGDSSSIPDANERNAAEKAKLAILQAGQDLVDRGLLPPDALKKYGDGYLPKLYLQYLLDDNDRYAIQRGQSNKVSNMDYLKRRGHVEESVAEFVKGVVKDPAFLVSKATIQPGRDMALLDMFSEMVTTSQQNNFNWVLPESIVDDFDYARLIAKIAGNTEIGMELKEQLAKSDSDRDRIVAQIEDLKQAIKKEREVLRAKDRMKSKALSAMIKEQQGLRDKLKAYSPKKMSGYGLKAEADRIFKTIYPQVRSRNEKEAKIVADLVDEMNKIADQTIGRVIIPKDYAQIPDNARYGSMRGLVVQKEIYDDLVGSLKMMKPENAAEAIIGEGGLLGKTSRLFKWSKVTANFPAAWVRNFSSNLVFMNIGGMPMGKIPYYLTKATREMIKTWKGEKSIYDEVKDFGLTSSTFASVELGRIEKEFENYLNRTQRKGTPFKAFFVAKELLVTMQDWTSDKYGLVDSLGKTMMYMNGIDKGMTPQEAADHAEKWLFDYSLVKPSVKTLRQSIVGAPFITYTTKVFPLLVETALTRPWRFAPYFALPYAMAALFKETHDLDDEEYEQLMMSLQEYMREKRYAGNIMPLPYLDKFGRPQFLDLAYLYPWGMFTEIASEAQDDPGAIMQTLGLLGGPVASIITVISSGGIDPFTRRPVANKLDAPEQRVKDYLTYIYNLMMPPFLHSDYGALNRIMQTLDGEMNRYGEPMKTIPQGLSQAVGFNVSPVDIGSQRGRNARYMQSEILKTMGYARRTLRDMTRMGKSDEEIKEKNEYFKKIINERKQKLLDYLKASKFPTEKLKQAN